MKHIRSFLHVKLDVADLDRSVAFYRDALGFVQIVRYDRDDGITIVQVSPTGMPPGIELWFEPPFRPAPDDRLHVALEARSLPDLVVRLQSLGVEIVREPFRIGHELIAFIRDPDGYLIELNEIVEEPGPSLD
jgi:lactoylglutathione lyase